jgi:hypothetical protein
MNTIPTPASAKAQYTYTPDRKREQAVVKPPAAHYRRAHENQRTSNGSAGIGVEHQRPVSNLGNTAAQTGALPVCHWRVEFFPDVGNRTLMFLLAFIIVRPSAPTDD